MPELGIPVLLSARSVLLSIIPHVTQSRTTARERHYVSSVFP